MFIKVGGEPEHNIIKHQTSYKQTKNIKKSTFFHCEHFVCSSLCFYDRVLYNFSVHVTRNYVFMAIKTH